MCALARGDRVGIRRGGLRDDDPALGRGLDGRRVHDGAGAARSLQALERAIRFRGWSRSPIGSVSVEPPIALQLAPSQSIPSSTSKLLAPDRSTPASGDPSDQDWHCRQGLFRSYTRRLWCAPGLSRTPLWRGRRPRRAPTSDRGHEEATPVRSGR